jgi:hypothetical protein
VIGGERFGRYSIVGLPARPSARNSFSVMSHHTVHCKRDGRTRA